MTLSCSKLQGRVTRLGPDIYESNQRHGSLKKKTKTKTWVEIMHSSPSKNLQANRSHYQLSPFPPSHLNASHHSNKPTNMRAHKKRAFVLSCPNLHYFLQAVSTACDCVLFRVTAVAQPKCRLTLFCLSSKFLHSYIQRHTCTVGLHGGGSLHALYMLLVVT
jgi:hypothetical protein